MRASEAGLFFGEGGVDCFSGQDKGDENGFAAARVGVVGRKASEAVASVDKLFNV